MYPQPFENSFHPLGRLRPGACGYHWLGKTGIVTNGDDDIFERDSDDNWYDHCTVFQVPGFTDLTLNDQMKLLQSSWTEVAQLFTNLTVILNRFNSLYNTHYYLPTSETKYLQQ